MIETAEQERLAAKVRQLQGPILVLGGSGFVGANLLRLILRERKDVVGLASRLPSWRLDGLDKQNVFAADLLVKTTLIQLLAELKPRTIFNCIAYGAYSFEVDSGLIYETNFNLTTRLLEQLSARSISAYVHAGSSSEYGDNAAGPGEEAPLSCNSDYAVSKAGAANLIQYYGRRKGLPCANLRLYSVYGPMEDASRLIPTVVRKGQAGELPEFVRADVSRDFIYVDDACEAFFDAGIYLSKGEATHFGESFNIGSGRKTTMAEVATASKAIFGIAKDPVFSMPERKWDVAEWYANPEKSTRVLGWKATTRFADGLKRMSEWYVGLADKIAYERNSKKFGLDIKHSVSAVVACYKDGQAIPIMYERLKQTFVKLNIDYEIIFVNDCSPDDSEECIRSLSRNDRRVIGISHSRNFGSQAAFRSGMEIARMNSCVLLDGDLQDPPELIENFVEQWRAGFDVVYGRRVKREATLFMQFAYKSFYRVFNYFSYVPVPRDAGDFSLLDRRVVQAMLRFQERDLFLRGVRAFAGFKQTGVDYVRPERMFGSTTNNLLRNVGWAKKGILSFSNVPLNLLSLFASILLVLSVILGIVQIFLRLLFPGLAASGITTILLLLTFFGGINIFAVALVGEYVAKIFEEVKGRPLFIRRSVIHDGEVRPFGDDSFSKER